MLNRFVFCVFASVGVLAGAELPTAEAVFTKAIEATGGKAVYQKTSAMLNRGTVEIVGQNIKGSIVIVAAKPDKTDTVMDLAGLGQMHMGTGNGIAWQTSAFQGPRVLDGEERDQMIRASALDGLVRWHETYGDVKVDGEETLDGKSCWRLMAMAPKSTKPETLWFEKESGLLVKSVATTVTAMGEIQIEAKYQDYRDEGGLKVAHTLRQAMGPQVILTTLQEIKLNPDLAAHQFDVPSDIQALLNKK